MTTIQIPPGESLDPFLKSLREPGTVFVLGAGTYTTQGCFGFGEHDLCMLPPGCSLVGAGRDVTTIRVENPVLQHLGKNTLYFEAVTGGAYNSGASSFLQLSDFTLDLSGVDVPRIGIHLWTSRAVVRGVCVTNVWGSRSHQGKVKEGFGILVNSSREAAHDGAHRVEDCWVTLASSPAENYSCGIYVGCVRRPVPMLRSRIVGCVVKSLPGCFGHAAYAANDLTAIESCQAHGFVRAFFCDTGPVRRVEISHLYAADVQWAVDVRVSQPGAVKQEIAVRDSQFYFQAADTEWAQVLLAADESGPPPTVIDEILFERCRFDASGIRQASRGRTRGAAAGPVQMRDCTWIGDWQTPQIQAGAKGWAVEDCDS